MKTYFYHHTRWFITIGIASQHMFRHLNVLIIAWARWSNYRHFKSCVSMMSGLCLIKNRSLDNCVSNWLCHNNWFVRSVSRLQSKIIARAFVFGTVCDSVSAHSAIIFREWNISNDANNKISANASIRSELI